MAQYPEIAPHPVSSTDPAPPPDRLLNLIAAHPDGLGIGALLLALKPRPARRSLQRRLQALLAQGRITTTGAARALRYRAVPALIAAKVGSSSASGLRAQIANEAYVLTSPEGERIKAYVRQPMHLRGPVAYDLVFLEAYAPNRSAYLAPSLRAQLHALGRSSVDSRARAGTFARDILARLLIDLSWASSRLEGNTYSRLDTERLIELGQAAAGKNAIETQMILNHKAAIEYLVGDAKVAVDEVTVIALHALLSDGLMHDPAAGGRVRSRAVEIGGSVFRPLAMPQRLSELFGLTLQMAAEIADPFEQAFFLLVHLPYLQPFEDVNKRTSRLAANIPLMRHNLCPLSFIDVPTSAYVDATLGVYELVNVDLLRDVFVWAYERSCQQYVAVKQELVPPDLFRLRHRAALSEAVKTVVRKGWLAGDRRLAQVVPTGVPRGERTRFVELLRAELQHLHEGTAVRHGLRALEVSVWLGKKKAANTR